MSERRIRLAGDEDEAGWWPRHALGLITGSLALLGIAALVFFLGGNDKAQPVLKPVPQVTLLKPPPPPPPPKVEPPKQPEKRAETPPEKTILEEPPPLAAPKELPPLPKLDDGPPPGPLGLDAVGEGTGDAYGLVGQPGGRGLIGSGSGGGGGGGAGQRFAWYAGVVEASLKQALDADTRTRDRRFRDVALQLWVGGDGRVTRARLIGSTGDAEIDRLLVTEVLPGLALREPPPPELTFPIAMRLGKRT